MAILLRRALRGVGRALAISAVLAGPLAAADRGGPGAATILFFNDAHQLSPVVDRYGERGGVARLATRIAEVRRERPATLVLFGGDLAGGTLFGGQFHGHPQVEALNLAGVDAAAFGQHDFDFGAANARALVAEGRFPWIATNLDEAASGKAFAGAARSLVFSRGGLRIGVLGLTDDMATTTQEGAVVQRDLVAAARAEVDALRTREPRLDAVVAMAQTSPKTAEALLAAIPALDVVLVEEEAEDRTTMLWLGRRLVAAPAGNLGSVVRADLVRTPKGLTIAARAVPVDREAAAEPRIAALTRTYEQRLDAALATPVGASAEVLTEAGARTGESALGDLVADAYRASCAADVGLVTGGSLRAALPAGRLRRRELAAVLPFGNRVVCRSWTGAALRAALEHGVAGMQAGKGTLLQVSGLRYRVRARGDAAAVIAVDVGGAPLDPARTYRVALSSFVAEGGDGFAVVGAATGNGTLDVDALEAHVRGTSAPLAPPEAGRILFER